MTQFEQEVRERQIQRWLCFFRNHEGYYSKAVYVIQNDYGCHDYDDEFEKKRKDVYIQNILKKAKKDIDEGNLKQVLFWVGKLKEQDANKDSIKELLDYAEEKEH